MPYGDRYGYQTNGETISHYYGDFVRDLFLGAAVVMLFASPFYADSIEDQFAYVVMGALVLVCLAALTNPWKRSIMIANGIASGAGMFIYQMWALGGYGTISPIAFVLREAISIIFIFALYFSMKTIRAMFLHQIGKRASPDEFRDAEDIARVSSDSEIAEPEDTVSKLKHAFDEGQIDDDDETPPHRPTFWEKTG